MHIGLLTHGISSIWLRKLYELSKLMFLHGALRIVWENFAFLFIWWAFFMVTTGIWYQVRFFLFCLRKTETLFDLSFQCLSLELWSDKTTSDKFCLWGVFEKRLLKFPSRTNALLLRDCESRWRQMSKVRSPSLNFLLLTSRGDGFAELSSVSFNQWREKLKSVRLRILSSSGTFRTVLCFQRPIAWIALS